MVCFKNFLTHLLQKSLAVFHPLVSAYYLVVYLVLHYMKWAISPPQFHSMSAKQHCLVHLMYQCFKTPPLFSQVSFVISPVKRSLWNVYQYLYKTNSFAQWWNPLIHPATHLDLFDTQLLYYRDHDHLVSFFDSFISKSTFNFQCYVSLKLFLCSFYEMVFSFMIQIKLAQSLFQAWSVSSQ